jgi:hypothetical protein
MYVNYINTMAKSQCLEMIDMIIRTSQNGTITRKDMVNLQVACMAIQDTENLSPIHLATLCISTCHLLLGLIGLTCKSIRNRQRTRQ